jgi:tetratricopeptide (TPR) repeat protein
MSFETITAAEPRDAAELVQLARAALQFEREEEALLLVRRGAEKHADPELWLWTGLLDQSLDNFDRALDAFAQGARLAPNNFRIARLHAQCALAAGRPAVALFEHVRSMRPYAAAAFINYTAALVAEGQPARAVSELQSALENDPFWAAGHQRFAQLMATLGRPEEATSSIEAAIDRFPKEAGLWETLLYVQLRHGAYETFTEILDRARKEGVVSAEFAIYEAIHAAQFDSATFPRELFDGAPAGAEENLRNWRIRHLLRVGAIGEALPIIDQALAAEPDAEIWSLAATVWRLAGDERSEWLEGDPGLVSVIDIKDKLPPLDKLGSFLRSLHQAEGEYLDQSVRGGTQTSGSLFSRVDPLIQDVRAAVVDVVGEFIARLPARDPRHPTFRHPRDRRIRFAGSWSVRLNSGGRHSNHIHPQGWISSALYIGLPPRTEGEHDDAGWLTLGEPDDKLGLNLPPWRTIEPKPGRLVLFPSWMWHGTRPFQDGERLTVAFDVAPPRGQ